MLSNELTFTPHPHHQWKADVNLRSGHTIFKMLCYAMNFAMKGLGPKECFAMY